MAGKKSGGSGSNGKKVSLFWGIYGLFVLIITMEICPSANSHYMCYSVLYSLSF
jgi:hypothetical protein